MSKAVQPLVSIVTLNWNTTDVTCDFLRSVREQNTYANVELIVVDNASSEDATATFLSVYPTAVIIRNAENLGFSGGNNVGIRRASGEYIFIVNNDTEFTPRLIENLLEVFAVKPDAGMVCPKLQYFFQKGTIEYAGYNSINIFTGRNTAVGNKEEDKGQYHQVVETAYGHGGAMLLPRKVIEEVGLMPEEFFLYYEELDWSAQIKRKGYKIYFQPAALIYHKESMTTGKMSPLKTYYLTRNRILFMRRNVSLPSFLVFISFFSLLAVPRHSILFLARQEKEHLRSFWKGILWHLGANHRPIETNRKQTLLSN